MDAIRPKANLLILLVLQLFIIIKLWNIEGWVGEGVVRLGVACASLILMVLLWNALLSRLPRRLALVLNILFVGGYHWLRHEPLTFKNSLQERTGFIHTRSHRVCAEQHHRIRMGEHHAFGN